MEPLRFFLRATAFSALVFLVMLVCSIVGPYASEVDYLGGLKQKHERLKALGSPKVVIIGGSNATFGINSEKLEQALCKPVVNMSIHASLGFRFMVNEVKAELGEGDLVIVSLEHSGYSRPEQKTEVRFLAVDRFPQALDYLPVTDYLLVPLNLMLMRTQATWKVIMGKWKPRPATEIYRASGFNERGDLISQQQAPPCPPKLQVSPKIEGTRINEAFWPVASDLVGTASAHHARVVFTWPAIARSSYREVPNATILEGLSAHGYTMIGRAEDYVQPDSAFQDTHYHLRVHGRDLRTEQLIKDLCAASPIPCCPREL